MPRTLHRAVAATALALLLAAGAAGPAAAKGVVYNASMYGIQRYEAVSEKLKPEDAGCYATYGTHTDTSSLRFTTKRPVRVRVSGNGRSLSITRVGGGDGPLFDLRGTFEASGSDVGEEFVCADDERPYGWQPAIIPLVPPCPATEIPLDAEFSGVSPNRLGVAGGQYIVPLNDPLADCGWGDRSFELYPAKRRVDLRQLVADGGVRELEVVLKGREAFRTEDAQGRAVTTRKTTVYVTFKKP